MYKTLDAESKVKHKEVYFQYLKELQEKDIEERKKKYNFLEEDLNQGNFITETMDVKQPQHPTLDNTTQKSPEEIQRQRRETLQKAKQEVEDYKKIFQKLKSDDLKNENIQNAD